MKSRCMEKTRVRLAGIGYAALLLVSAGLAHGQGLPTQPVFAPIQGGINPMIFEQGKASGSGLICGRPYSNDLEAAKLKAREARGECGSGKSAPIARSPSSAVAVPGISPSLSFPYSAALRRNNIVSFVAQSRAQNPAGAAQVAKFFTSTDVLSDMGKSLIPYGLRPDNVADAYAVYWKTAWLAAHGRIEGGSRAQAQAIKQQVANRLIALRAMATADNTTKQEFADTMLMKAAIINSSVRLAKGNPAQLAAIARIVRQRARESGLDLDATNLTEAGFEAVRR